jgi:hypothetical protein
MTIAFFGDSFTQGTPFRTDDPDIWPNLVAKHFYMKADNQFVAGGSNHAILRNLVHYMRKNADVDAIIVTWSHWNRSEVHHGEIVYQMQPNGNSFPGKFINQWYKDMNTDVQFQDWVDKTWIVDKLLKNKIPHFQWCAFPDERKRTRNYDPENWLPTSILDVVDGVGNTPCGHPTKEGHKIIAECVIEHLQKKQILL